MLAGAAAAAEMFLQVDPEIDVSWHAADGEAIAPGDVIAAVGGRLRSILGAERTVLNLLQHASGVATLTRAYVEAVDGRSRVRDTRKTLPGLRALEKAAVRAGGGFNHRECLSDAILIKDNHLAFGDLTAAVDAIPNALARSDRRGRVRYARPGPGGGRGRGRSDPARQHGARRRPRDASTRSTVSCRSRSPAA